MPGWTRLVFLQVLPTVLFMKRPRKTRLQWMTDMSSERRVNLGDAWLQKLMLGE